MILKMRRYSFLIYHKQYTDFLEKIRDLGVLHVIEKTNVASENESLIEKMQFSARIKNTIKQLEKFIPKDTKINEEIPQNASPEILYQVENLLAAKEQLENKHSQVVKECERMEVWGAFDYNRLAELKNAGFVIGFYSCSLRNFDQEWEVKYNAFEIETVASTVYFVTVTQPGEKIDIDADIVKLAPKSAEQLSEEAAEILTQIAEKAELLTKLAVENLNELKGIEIRNFDNIAYDKVVLSTERHADDRVMVLEGWCPEESEASLLEYLETSGVYFENSVPTEEDKIPIKLKNNGFAKLFEPIGEMYDLPNYHELDLTPFFAPFYMLFFGLCLGDAAYGLLFLIIAIILRFKAKPSLKPLLNLVIWLGSSTVIMGFISGTFLGFSLIDAKIEWLEKFKGMMLDANKLFYTSLILGVVQIFYGIFVKAYGIVKRYGWFASLSTWGWFVALVGGSGTYLSTAFLGLEAGIAKYMYYVFFGTGILLVFILNDIKRNPLINIGAGLWDSYNMATGLLGDTLSYVRLFALGICGSVMGFVFNDLAFKLSGDIPVVSTIIMLLIMIIGHGINIFMSTLGAFVHPMRLTFVEFYKNAGFEGGGKKYNPFARYKKNESFL